MHIIFTDEENEWIEKIPFNWRIKDGTPDDIMQSLEKKFSLLKKQQEEARGNNGRNRY